MTLRTAFLILALFFANCITSAQNGSGVATFTSGVYIQNFNSLVSASCPCGNVAGDLPTGWYVDESGTAAAVDDEWALNAGTSSTGNLYVYGTGATPTDKALGSIATGTLSPMWGVNLSNNTGAIITSLRVQFTGESWRVVNRGTADRIDFQYKIGGAITDASGWTDVDPLDFRTLPLGTGATTTTGAGNSELLMDYTIAGLSVPISSTIFLRWVDADVTGNDDGAAIDDLTVTANPVCGSSYFANDFESGSLGACWSSSGIGVAAANAIFNTNSGHTSTATAVSGASTDQLRTDISATGLYQDLNSATSSTLNWEFTVRTDLTGQTISTSNLWGYFLYNNQFNFIGTVNNTGYAVGVNLGGSSDKTIKLYKLNGQRWDAGAIGVLITSSYVYPGTASTLIDKTVTIKVVRTGNNASANWELFVNGVSQGTAADASPVLSNTSNFYSGFFNQHNASRVFEIDDIVAYKGTARPCVIGNNVCTTLPIKLLYFNGAYVNANAILQWEVGNPDDLKLTQIEKSTDGVTFNKIGTVAGHGKQSAYTFSVLQNEEKAYYRLRLIEWDGSITNSGIISIVNKQTKNISIVVSTDMSTVFINMNKYATGVIEVVNTSGQRIMSQNISNQKNISLPIQSLSSGTYYLRITDHDGTVLHGNFSKL